LHAGRRRRSRVSHAIAPRHRHPRSHDAPLGDHASVLDEENAAARVEHEMPIRIEPRSGVLRHEQIDTLRSCVPRDEIDGHGRSTPHADRHPGRGGRDHDGARTDADERQRRRRSPVADRKRVAGRKSKASLTWKGRSGRGHNAPSANVSESGRADPVDPVQRVDPLAPRTTAQMERDRHQEYSGFSHLRWATVLPANGGTGG